MTFCDILGILLVILLLLFASLPAAAQSQSLRITAITWADSLTPLPLPGFGAETGWTAGTDSLLRHQIQKGRLERGYWSSQLTVRAETLGTEVHLTLDGSTGPRSLGDSFLVAGVDLAGPSGVGLGITEDFRDQVVTPELLDQQLDLLSRSLAERGYPFATVEYSSLRPRPSDDKVRLTVEARVETLACVVLDTQMVQGLTLTHPEVVLRETWIPAGSRYAISRVSAAQRRVNRLAFVTASGEPTVTKLADGRYGLLWRMTERSANQIEGAVGYLPASGLLTETWTGLVRARFPNLLGTGRLVSVYWAAPSRDRRDWSLLYLEPWIFGTPLDVKVSLAQESRESLWTRTTVTGEAIWHISGDWSARFDLSQATLKVDSVGIWRWGLRERSDWTLLLGGDYSTLDDPVNPGAGIGLTFSGEGTLSDLAAMPEFAADTTAGTEVRFKASVMGEWNWFPWGAHGFHAGLAGGLVNRQGGPPAYADLLRLGGARSVRGYREEQIYADSYGLLTLEYRFRLDRTSRIYPFVDWGAARLRSETVQWKTLLGYGLGLRTGVSVGQLGVDFAWSPGLTFGQGRVHVLAIVSF